MSKFDDFISVLPLETLKNITINNNRVIIPNDIDSAVLYDACKETIVEPSLSPEKALYVALQSKLT